MHTYNATAPPRRDLYLGIARPASGRHLVATHMHKLREAWIAQSRHARDVPLIGSKGSRSDMVHVIAMLRLGYDAAYIWCAKLVPLGHDHYLINVYDQLRTLPFNLALSLNLALPLNLVGEDGAELRVERAWRSEALALVVCDHVRCVSARLCDVDSDVDRGI